MQAIGRLGKRMISARGSLGRWKGKLPIIPRAPCFLSLYLSKPLRGGGRGRGGGGGGREGDRQTELGWRLYLR